ncbi:thiopeptide-type bacteriocin biosynthesis protein [uncultured Winogradskyella sp.]|uniref:thiopeptide-type bacteriocin biosynthesis protein n=1 Tax=uncultured Winogradskyella sp. TaxID=395353 RepID=UPI00260529F0|nr:thiopeptide-type bacteriocin biosynthesis protein [uncultured Winogradskyella sp.]
MENSIKRNFVIGDQWMYYKLYCGVNVADDILIDAIVPFTKKQLDNNIISSWFFIRYNDPDFHLRIRFKLICETHTGIIISELKKLLIPHLNSGFIWDVQLHQYKREIERYGSSTITYIENLFFWDSETILKAKEKQLTEEESIIFIVKLISIILSQFKFSKESKFKFAEKGRNAFKSEFNANKITMKDLSERSRKILSQKESFRKTNLLQLLKTYSENTNQTFTKINELYNSGNVEVSLNNLTSSIIHMTINRYFNSNQRLYEFLIYDVLYKEYKTDLFKPSLK